MVQDQIYRLTISTTQPKLALFRIEKLEIPLPPLNQQTQIVEEIEKRFSVADKMEAAIDESLKKSEALRQSILKQAFEGKLV
ncbi:MAG: restriction endonuclease subunit S [Melioribacteraceae bacterium]|nr:restriction endonuclease subunit S [Melioribacteraceae bacterium]